MPAGVSKIVLAGVAEMPPLGRAGDASVARTGDRIDRRAGG